MTPPDTPSTDRQTSRVRALWQALRVAPLPVGQAERWRAVAGGTLGILFTALVSRWLAGPLAQATWLVAPLGASALLVFALPSSPLAQPWPVVAGNTVSALAGITCAMWIPDPALAGALALGLAMGLMFALRCLHPPGAATALLVVMMHATHFEFALFPVMVNSVLLVLGGMAYNSLTGKPYPHRAAAPAQPAQAPQRFSPADLDSALAHYNQVLDVNREDLQALLHLAEVAAFQRHLGQLRCSDIMSANPHAVQFGTPLDEAWTQMRTHGIKALPVIDKARRMAGIVTRADFLKQLDQATHDGLGDRLRAFVRRNTSLESDRPEVVGQIMTRQVRVASADRLVVELVPLFSQGRHHHIPIIDADNRLVGIITQSDFVRTLYKALQPA